MRRPTFSATGSPSAPGQGRIPSASMPTARWGAAAAEYNGEIYVFGGTTAGRTGSNKCECFNVAGNYWTTKTDMPFALNDGVMAVTVGSKIYIFYGTTTLEFNPSGNGGMGSYTSKRASPVFKQWGTCAYVNVDGEDRIYIIGGSNGSLVFQSTNYYYRPDGDDWSSPQAPAPRPAHGMTRDNPVYNNKIYYGFGWSGGMNFYRDLYCYDPATDSWFGPIAYGHIARDGVACGVVGNTIYFIGGRNTDPEPYGLDINESYQIE